MGKRALIILILLLLVSVFGCTELSTTLETTAITTTSVTTTVSISTTTQDETSTSIISTSVSIPATTITTAGTTTEPTTTVTTIPTLEFEYDKLSDADMMIELSNIELTVSMIETSLGVHLGETEVTVSGIHATFKQAYLYSLNLGDHEFNFSTSEGEILVIIYVTDTRMPYLESIGSFPYVEDTDVILTFVMFSGSFFGLSGNDITTDDYDFSNNQLTIYYDYIISKFIDTPERTALILTYILKYPGGTRGGWIYIQKP